MGTMTATRAQLPPNQKWQHENQHTTRKQQRERGTLKETLPGKSSVLFILTIVCLASSSLATLLVCYSRISFPIDNEADLRDAAKSMAVEKSMGLAMMGSASTLVGIVYGDSLCHSFAFGVMIFIVLILSMEDFPSSINLFVLKSSLKIASPPLIASILTSVPLNQSLLNLLDFSSVVGIHAVIVPVILSLAYLFIVTPQIAIDSPETNYSSIALTPTCIVSILTLALFLAYYQNRSHKSGCLLTPSMKSHALISSIAIISSSILPLLLLPDSKTNMAILPTLTLIHTSSIMTLLLAHLFASTADVWYAVGSGQFQMISLDTAGMILYFILPAVVIYFRFLEKYGDTLQSIMGILRERVVGSILGSLDMEHTTAALIFIGALSAIHAVGVPLLNSLCPLGGYLYSRSYIHGRPNTKKVALCFKFADIPRGESYLLKFLKEMNSACDTYEDEADKLSVTTGNGVATEDDDTPNVVLNILVTKSEIEKYPTQLKELVKRGHEMVLSAASMSSGVQNFFQGNKAVAELKNAYGIYSNLIGEPPKWYFALSSDGMGRHPTLLHETSNLGMKVAYWSTMVSVNGWNLGADQLYSLKSDVRDTNGGSIIYVTLSEQMKAYVKRGEGADESGLTSSVICQIVHSLRTGENNFSFEALSTVVKDDATMVL